MRMLHRAVALAAVLLVVAGLAATAWVYRDPERIGVDEINYLYLQPFTLNAGAQVAQPLRVEAPHLARVAFVYSYLGPSAATVQVSVRSAGRTIADRRLRLGRTVSPLSHRAWWEANRYESLAALAEVPLESSASGRIIVFISVPAGDPAVTLYWSQPPLGALPSIGNLHREYALRTEYGPIRPALTMGPTFAGRVAASDGGWIPAGGLMALALGVIILVGAATWRMAGPRPGPDDTVR